MCMMTQPVAICPRSYFHRRVPAPASAGARKGLVWPCKAIQQWMWASVRTACSQACFAAHDSNPAAEQAMSSSVFLWHSWCYYLGTSQTWIYLRCFPTKWRDNLSPILRPGKRGRKKGAEGFTITGTVQLGMPKAFHFPERYNDIFYTAALLSFCCNCDCSGFQVRPLGLKPDTQNMKNT